MVSRIGGGGASRWQRRRLAWAGAGLSARSAARRRSKHQSAQSSFLEQRRRARMLQIRLAIVPVHEAPERIREIVAPIVRAPSHDGGADPSL